jgi:hypothetical protein
LPVSEPGLDADTHDLASTVPPASRIPNARLFIRTRATTASWLRLREEAPSRSFDRYDRQPTRDGFLVHYAYRTQATGDQPSYLSVGLIAATVGGGVVTEVTITCAGSWDAQREAEILDRTAAVVS